ncbi:hypothetical protein D9M71_825390 [compost metagenome]
MPHRIGAGHMSGQQPVCSVIGVDFKGDVICIQTGLTRCYEDAQRIVADDSVQVFWMVLGEVFGNVHGDFIPDCWESIMSITTCIIKSASFEVFPWASFQPSRMHPPAVRNVGSMPNCARR